MCAYLDPMIHIDVFPAAIRMQPQVLVLGHHFARRNLHVGFNLCRTPHALEAQVEVAEEVRRRLGQWLRVPVRPSRLRQAPAVGHVAGLATLRRTEFAATDCGHVR